MKLWAHNEMHLVLRENIVQDIYVGRLGSFDIVEEMTKVAPQRIEPRARWSRVDKRVCASVIEALRFDDPQGDLVAAFERGDRKEVAARVAAALQSGAGSERARRKWETWLKKQH